MKDSLDYCRFLNEFINEKLSGNIDDLNYFNNQILKDTLNLKYDDIGTGKKYRGDTLYTFNTYFGTDMQCAKDLSDNNGNFLSKVREFNKKYCSFYVDESKRLIII